MSSFFGNLFGGAAEREAADRNRRELGQYTQQSLGALNRGLATSEDALRTGANQANSYLGGNYGLYDNLRGAGYGLLDQGRTGALGALGNAGASYGALAGKYGAGTNLYLDSLGTNGAEGNQRATNAFQAGPGYQFAMDQGQQALERSRARRGMLASGNTDVDTLNFSQGLANQEYGNWQNRLGGLINPELAATQGQAGIGRDTANLYQQDALSRLGLEQGVTQGQTGANTARGVNDVALGNNLSNLYTGNASDRVGVYGNNLSGQMNANNMQAQGEAQGSRNLFNGLTGLASLATGSFGAGGMFGRNGFFGQRS